MYPNLVIQKEETAAYRFQAYFQHAKTGGQGERSPYHFGVVITHEGAHPEINRTKLRFPSRWPISICLHRDSAANLKLFFPMF